MNLNVMRQLYLLFNRFFVFYVFYCSAFAFGFFVVVVVAVRRCCCCAVDDGDGGGGKENRFLLVVSFLARRLVSFVDVLTFFPITVIKTNENSIFIKKNLALSTTINVTFYRCLHINLETDNLT